MQQPASITAEPAALAGSPCETFRALEKYLIGSGLGSDLAPFEVIRSRLITPPTLTPEDFAKETFYVILASGFSQKTAKRIWAEIVHYYEARGGSTVCFDDLFAVFHNRNKINAILQVWQNRAVYCGEFYARPNAEEKIKYLATLPHIGKITAHHLARNLGISVVKYDVWIQRLALACAGKKGGPSFPIRPEVIRACDILFSKLEQATGHPKGYIDVVLWKSCQLGLIHLPERAKDT
ncbi:MAG: hypothetical protein LBD20_09090 [Spirochaetaceae bacterium]|jgi:hypothetical protein|nr:hypothetical protein [Spirochaetaceae bacterium]